MVKVRVNMLTPLITFKVHNVLEKYIDFLMGENAEQGKPIQVSLKMDFGFARAERKRSVETG